MDPIVIEESPLGRPGRPRGRHETTRLTALVAAVAALVAVAGVKPWGAPPQPVPSRSPVAATATRALTDWIADPEASLSPVPCPSEIAELPSGTSVGQTVNITCYSAAGFLTMVGSATGWSGACPDGSVETWGFATAEPGDSASPTPQSYDGLGLQMVCLNDTPSPEAPAPSAASS